MSVINPNETAKSWKAQRKDAAVHLYLTGADGDAAALIGARVAGFPLHLSLIPVTDWIDPEDVSSAAVAVVQVDPNTPASIKRFQKLAASIETPLIAAAYDPPLALVRALVRAGAHDVVPLPLDIADLETSIAPVRDELSRQAVAATAGAAKLVSVIKSVGGAGATALLTQLAIRFAENEARYGREACLIDLDVQFGDVAFQLGLRPNLSIADLIDAGARIDGELLRATTTKHSSGLRVIAAPTEMLPIESLQSDQLIEIVSLAKREFGTVFVDLPSNWTNWSLSLLAQSNIVLLVTELSVSSLNRARRQIDLIRSQDLESLDVRVVVNRFEKNLLRTIRESDVRDALGHDISYTIANEPQIMRAALDRGVPINEVKRRSAIAKDLDILDAGLAAALRLER
ncbi:MAG TPA: pilus assembly protein CpaE [Sphingomicrobium sp.]|nr:pilus assembly protein CpaE [Sphingomicrobium sp.]